MTSDPKKDRLACIDDFIIAEILKTSDADILAEVAPVEIEEAQQRFEQVKLGRDSAEPGKESS